MAEVNFYLSGSNNFNASWDTYVITHGYQSSSTADWVAEMAQAIKQRDSSSNVILTDWSSEADTLFYSNAVDDVFDVGFELGNLLAALGANPNTTQLIGHSLGAHVSGVAGDIYEDITGSSIGAIVGLDPAGPSYESSGVPLQERLDANDARQVAVLHTSETLGFDDRLGDLDLYINPNDLFQPGQFSFLGNHSYAHELYTDLIEGFGHFQSDGDLGGIFDYDDLFTYVGSGNIDTTSNPVFVG
ncbi:MAG: hypothetical protein QNJ64_16260 [Crocosphaera sp.]|nr:hypothetical protein [Crocosphaera sp.]